MARGSRLIADPSDLSVMPFTELIDLGATARIQTRERSGRPAADLGGTNGAASLIPLVGAWVLLSGCRGDVPLCGGVLDTVRVSGLIMPS